MATPLNARKVRKSIGKTPLCSHTRSTVHPARIERMTCCRSGACKSLSTLQASSSEGEAVRGSSSAATEAPPGWGWCWEPPAGAGRAWPARGKRRGGRHGRHAPAGGVPAPPGQLSGARARGPRANGYQGVAGRGGYVARARHRVATPGAATSGRGARSRFPLVSTYRIGGLVLNCT